MIAKVQLELTPREIDVVLLIWEELTAAEIAARLGISPRTVEAQGWNIRQKVSAKISPRTVEAQGWNIRQKVSAKSTVGILKYALQAGLFRVETV